MFAGWGSWVARFRWPVLVVALVAVISAGVWGLGVFGQLTEGGYNDPNSESTLAADAVRDAFGPQGGDLVVIYTPVKGKIDDAALGKRIRDNLGALPKSAVTGRTSYWHVKSAQFAAKDKSSGVALITLAGADDGAKLESFRAIDDKLAVPGARVQLSGATVLADASSSRSTSDLGKAEAISLPITLILLVLIFGSLVAASLPVLVGGAAVLGSLGILHAVAGVHDVNSFAVNVASLLGLGMAIDYGLFMVGRFREEQAAGRSPEEAVARTVATAGRTVVFSATLLMIALGGLLLFPQGFLKSLAYGGLAAVFLAAVLSLTLLPALLAVLGPRVDKLPVRLSRRPRGDVAASGWARLADFVLRRPLLVAIPILGILLLLAAPIRGVHFGEADERTLPAGDPARVAIETLKADYPQFTGNNVQIVLKNAKDTAGFAVALRQVPGIAQIGTARKATGVATFTATLSTKDAFGTEARDAIEAIRALPVPPGAQLLVGGTTARNVDSIDATADRLPLMVGLLVGATLLLMFLAFGSILLPIKAVLMSALSLSATFGALVWIFQDGHGSGLLGVSPAPLEVGIVVLMAAVVFGLSTDYEVFLLSRMVEARAKGASTREAVTVGLARTGRVISAAAILLIVVTGAFALSSVTTMRFVGVGMIIALLLDATVVRMLLVPAVLSLLGDAAWWAPGPLRRLQQRAGLSEYAAEEAIAAAPAAAPKRAAHPGSGDPRPEADDHVSGESGSEADRTMALPSAEADRTTAVPSAEADRTMALPSAEDERPSWALPAAPEPLALPVGAPDETQVFARFDETAILHLPEAFVPDGDPEAHRDAEEVEAEILPSDELSGPRSGADDAYDAEIFEADDPAPVSGTTYVSEAAGRYVPDYDPDAPNEPERVVPADLSEWQPAVPGYETTPAPAPDWTSSDDGFFFGPGASTLALPAGLDAFDRPWGPAVFDESEIRPGRDAFFPEVTAPQTAQPDDTVPEAAQPEYTAPDVEVASPEAAQPEFTAPEFTAPKAAHPDVAAPEAAAEPTTGPQPLPSTGPAREPESALVPGTTARVPEKTDRPEEPVIVEEAATVDLAQRLAANRAPWTPINAALGEPLPRRSLPAAPEPASGAESQALVRRPADLADHLREARPSDLSEYTSTPPRIPRTRRPTGAKPLAIEGRPATLADHLSAAERATRDLREHADQE